MTEPLSPFQVSDRLTLLPVVHGSGSCALAVRKWLLDHPCDCLAVCLPESFKSSVLEAVERLPIPSMVLQRPSLQFGERDWADDVNGEREDDRGSDETWSYVPIDPCQPVIMALRVGVGEHWDIEFCDLETNEYQPVAAVMPDAYALKNVSLERFATAVLPSITRPFQEQTVQRLKFMALRLRELVKRYRHVTMICSILEWPWLLEAYREADDESPLHDSVELPISYGVNSNSLIFLFGELPYITGLYERARMQLEDDENLTIDGFKQLLISARSSYQQDLGKRGRKITPKLLMQCLKYIRNLSLIEHRMSPDLYTVGTAALQILGDQYAIHVIETARSYPFTSDELGLNVTLGIDQARLPDGETVSIVSRLPGHPVTWRPLELKRCPTPDEVEKWKTRWNPYSQCSWPPEDSIIESFRTRVIDRAKALIGADLARSEKFTTSFKDGIDIRETLRHWYDGDIYVKTIPPTVGTIDCCVMLFDIPADPREYQWRTTWFAEHEEESTLAFFATDFTKELVGPGIAVATYGGAMFLYPPVPIVDIWQDPRLGFAEDLESRLIAAACLNSREKHIALLSPKPAGATWRQIARRFHKNLVHIPLGQFNDAMVQQMRTVHVLEGQQVRSYAEHFIRKV